MLTDTHMQTHTCAHMHTNYVVLYLCRLLIFFKAWWIQ